MTRPATFRVQLNDNVTVTPLHLGKQKGGRWQMTCNHCHRPITERINDRKLCQRCYDEWELKRVQGGKRARRVFWEKRRKAKQEVEI